MTCEASQNKRLAQRVYATGRDRSRVNPTIQDNEAMVSDKFERLRHIQFTSAMISEMEVVGYIGQLNLGKAAGADGLTAEHYVYAIGSSVPLHISSMLTVCL